MTYTMYIYYDMILYVIENSINDYKAFIFTLKNPHEVEPSRFMKRDKYSNF